MADVASRKTIFWYWRQKSPLWQKPSPFSTSNLEEKGSAADQETADEPEATSESETDQKPEAGKRLSLPATLEKLRSWSAEGREN